MHDSVAPAELLARLRTLAEIIDPPRLSVPTSRDRDDDDDAVLALALASRADLIVSGDRDLLPKSVSSTQPQPFG
jgi:putative PIN family toxin of toxin-antitoxin system